MAFGPELSLVIDKFNGISSNDDDTIINDSQFVAMENFYIGTSEHEIKGRPGFIDIGAGFLTPLTSLTYMARFNTATQDSILLFPAPGDTTNNNNYTGVVRKDFDSWMTCMHTGGLDDTYNGRVTTSVFYIDKEYFYGPGLAKDVTWSIDLAGNNAGGASNLSYSVTLEQCSLNLNLNEDVSNPGATTPTLPVGQFGVESVVVGSDVTTLITAAGGSNVFKTFTGTLTLDDKCFCVKLSVQTFNSGDPIGNKRLRIRNPSLRATNYSTIANRIVSPDFKNFTSTWGRRVVAYSSNPANEILLGINAATQTSTVVNELGSGVIEIYPVVINKTASIASTAIEVTTKPLKYYFPVPTYLLNFNKFNAPPLMGAHLFKDRVFGFNSGESRLWFSDIGNPESWPLANFIDIGNSDEKITGLTSLQDKLIIFKDSSVYFLYVTAATTTWNLRKITDAYGCSSQYTIKHNGGHIYFVGTDGVYRTDGQSFEDISLSIRNIFENRTILEGNYPNYFFDHAGFWKDNYVVSLKAPFPNENFLAYTKLYVYNTTYDCWYIWAPTNFNLMGFFIEDDLDSGWGSGLLCCNSNGRFINFGGLQWAPTVLGLLPNAEVANYNANNTKSVNARSVAFKDYDKTFILRLVTKSLTFDDAVSWKRVKWIDLICQGNMSVDVKPYLDSLRQFPNVNAVQQISYPSTGVDSTFKSVKSKIAGVCKALYVEYIFTPRSPLGFVFAFNQNMNTNYISTTGIRLGAFTIADIEQYRPKLSLGFGYKMVAKVANVTATLKTPFFSVLAGKNISIQIPLDQQTMQAGNSRFCSIAYYNSGYFSLGGVTIENNVAWTTTTDLISYSGLVPANVEFAQVTLINNSATGYWYIKYFDISCDTAGNPLNYIKNKLSVFSIRIFLHKMRRNIKNVT